MAERVTVRNVGKSEVMVQFWLLLPGETVTVDRGTLELLRQQHGDVFMEERTSAPVEPMAEAMTEPMAASGGRKGRAQK